VFKEAGSSSDEESDESSEDVGGLRAHPVSAKGYEPSTSHSRPLLRSKFKGTFAGSSDKWPNFRSSFTMWLFTHRNKGREFEMMDLLALPPEEIMDKIKSSGPKTPKQLARIEDDLDWNLRDLSRAIIDALTGSASSHIRSCKPNDPQGQWAALCRDFDGIGSVSLTADLIEAQDYYMRPGSSLVQATTDLEEIFRRMVSKGENLSERIKCDYLLACLPPEYHVARAAIYASGVPMRWISVIERLQAGVMLHFKSNPQRRPQNRSSNRESAYLSETASLSNDGGHNKFKAESRNYRTESSRGYGTESPQRLSRGRGRGRGGRNRGSNRGRGRGRGQPRNQFANQNNDGKRGTERNNKNSVAWLNYTCWEDEKSDTDLPGRSASPFVDESSQSFAESQQPTSHNRFPKSGTMWSSIARGTSDGKSGYSQGVKPTSKFLVSPEMNSNENVDTIQSSTKSFECSERMVESRSFSSQPLSHASRNSRVVTVLDSGAGVHHVSAKSPNLILNNSKPTLVSTAGKLHSTMHLSIPTLTLIYYQSLKSRRKVTLLFLVPPNAEL
jgi:hypothetical protein